MTTTEQTAKTQLDWRALAVEPEIHWCGCEYCPMDGELEPKFWPILVTSVRGDVDYVTDRYLMVRAERAPIPVAYEGAVMAGPDLADRWLEAVTSTPAEGLAFRESTLQALNTTGWRLVLLDHPADANKRARRRVGVVDENGEHIGWAVAEIGQPA